MNKRTAVKLGIVVTACLTLFTSGCGTNSSQTIKLDPQNPVSLEIWHYYNGPRQLAFDKLVDEFNNTVGQEEGIIVEAFSQGNVSQLIQNVIDAANKKVGSGPIPDVFAAYADTAYQVDKLGLVAELDKYFTEEELAEYVSGYLEEGRFGEGGKLKIFPIAKSTELLMLNQTDWNKFADATGADVDSLSTFEGLTKTAEEYYKWTDSLTPEVEDGKALFGRDAVANYFIIGCKQLGVDIFSSNRGEAVINVEEDVMRKLWDNFYIPYINGYFGAYGRFRSDDAKTGDIIALVGSTSGSAYFPEKVTVNDTDSYDIESAFFPAPVFEDGERYAVQQGAGMVVAKSEPKVEYAATVFLKWFTEAERNIRFSINSGYLPVKKAANDMTLIESSFEDDSYSISNILRKSIPVAIDVVNTHELYTNKAFDGGTEARDVLEDHLVKKAKADREKVLSMIEEGMSREEAVSNFDTDENFGKWLSEFQAALYNVVD